MVSSRRERGRGRGGQEGRLPPRCAGAAFAGVVGASGAAGPAVPLGPQRQVGAFATQPSRAREALHGILFGCGVKITSISQGQASEDPDAPAENLACRTFDRPVGCEPDHPCPVGHHGEDLGPGRGNCVDLPCVPVTHGAVPDPQRMRRPDVDHDDRRLAACAETVRRVGIRAGQIDEWFAIELRHAATSPDEAFVRYRPISPDLEGGGERSSGSVTPPIPRKSCTPCSCPPRRRPATNQATSPASPSSAAPPAASSPPPQQAEPCRRGDIPRPTRNMESRRRRV